MWTVYSDTGKNFKMSEKPKAGEVHPVKTFLETTSVKGVPRMMKSRHVIFRVLWALAVLLGAGIAIYFLVELFRLYYSYKVTMSVKELQEQNLEFPSLTLCNLNPLGNTERNATEIEMCFYEFAEFTGYGHFSEELRYVMGQALDMSTLFVNFAQDDGTLARNFVVSCRWDADVLESESSCVEDAEMNVFQTTYGNCFTFNPPENSSYVYGFSAILYLDDTLGVNLPSVELNLARPFAAGAVLTTHQRHTLPNMEHGLVLSAGISSEVHLSLSRRIQLPPPYSNCSPQPTLPLNETSDYIYTQDTCIALCYQNEIVRRCSCRDGSLLSIKSQFPSGVPYCRAFSQTSSVTEGYYLFANRSLCIRSVFMDFSCDKQCPTSCHEERYVPTLAPIIWPHPTMQLAFYTNYISQKPYKEAFRFYGTLSAMQDQGNTTPAYLFEMLRQNALVRDNFLQVRGSGGK